jgi:hypothetical protein
MLSRPSLARCLPDAWPFAPHLELPPVGPCPYLLNLEFSHESFPIAHLLLDRIQLEIGKPAIL